MATDFANLLKVLTTHITAPISEGELQADLRSLKAVTEELLSPPVPQDPTRPDQALKALPTLLASLATCKRADSALTQSLIGDVMSDVLLMLPRYHQQPKYYEALKACVDFEKHYFKTCGQEIAPALGFSCHPDFTEDQMIWWKQTLTVGDELDAVRVDVRTNKKCWARATIIAADSEDDTLTLAYDGEGSSFNRFFKRFSPEIAPLATYTQGNEWRKQLKRDDLIDAYDLEGQWHNSTVLEKRFLSNSNGTQTIEINVGFRVYEHNGTKYDEIGSYRGWSSRYDEWVSVQSPRIAQYSQMARRWPIPPVPITEEAVMDDSNDLIELRSWAFAMMRDQKSRNRFFIRNLNRFGVAGLFNFAINAINNVETPLAFECFCGLMDFCGRIYSFYHKQFAKQFVQRLIDAAANYLLSASESQVRNFSKEKIDLLCVHFENLYKRILTIEQKNERMDVFQLNFAHKCFQSQYLDRRIQGLKVIVELTKGCKYPQTRTIRSSFMTMWIREHAILETIFGPQSHTQLIQRSGEIIHLLLTENSFETKLLQIIWNVAEKTDEDSKMTVYKVLSENASYFRAEHLEFLVDKISALPFDKLLKEEIELVHDLTKFPMKASSVLHKVSELLLQIVREDVNISQVVAEQALDRFCEILKGWDMRSNRLGIMIRCTNSVRENKAAIQCLKIIKKTMQSFPGCATTNDILSRYDVEMSLIADHDLMIAFFDNFRHFKTEAGKRIAPGMTEEAISSLVICDRTPYKEQIEERLSFLQVMYANSRLRLTQGYVSELWALCIEKAACVAERLTFLSWLAEVTDSQSIDHVTLEESGLVPFFHTKIAAAAVDLSIYPLKSFLVFRNYFLLCNMQLGRMKALPKPLITTTYPNYYNNAPDPPAVKEFEYQVLALPRELEGMELLRKLILLAKTQKTMEDATEFLCELYDNLAPEIQENLADIRLEFIEFCKAEISAMVNRATAVTLLKRFLEESEKRGTGGLKSHSAMLRGDLYTITILNKVSYYANCAHIPEKVDFKVHGNTSVWELRCMAGKAAKIYWDQVRLERTFTHHEIKDNQNGKTIAELRLKTHDTLIVTCKQLNIPKFELLMPDGEIAEKAKSIFLSWFYDFADRNGKMNAEGCANFTNSCTGEHCKADEKRMQDFVSRFDDDEDGYLTAANFLEFYKDALVHGKAQSVWNNLYAHNYRNDLKCYLDIGSERVDATVLPSYLLTQDSSSYDLLFSALADPLVANEAWELLIRLPTNPHIWSQLAVLDGAEVPWDQLLDSTSVHKLLYSLQVLEALAEDPVDAKPEERQRRTEWKLQFLQKGGFKHVYAALKRLQGRQDSFHKNCLVYILNLISTYMLAAFKALEPEVYEAVEFVRRGSEMLDQPEVPEIEPPKSVKFAESVETQTEEVVYGPQPPPADTIPVTVEEGNKTAAQEVTKSKAFQDLVEGLKLDHCAERVISEVKFEDVLEELIELISSTLELPEYETEDKHIIEASLALLISCVLHNHQLIRILYAFCEHSQSQQPFVFKGMCSTNIAISKSFSSTLQQICLHVRFEERPPLAYFLSELLHGLPASFIDSKVADYTQYFELMANLVVEDLKKPSQDYKELAGNLMDRIIAHPYIETRMPYTPDKVLQGLMQVTEKIFLFLPELKDLAAQREFPQQIWELCLFPEPADFSTMQLDLETALSFSSQRPPKGKLRETRSPAYRLLSTLAGNHRENMHTIVTIGLERVKNRLEKVASWNYSPSSDLRSVYGYSGIVNLGNICYMNSMLQQFYMIPQFRYAILEAEDGKPPTNLAYLRGDPGVNRTAKGADVDENILHQLQTLFGYLELSEKQAFNPSHFCFALKDFEGQPVNISLQQDAQEFLNMAFDRLEGSLKGTRHQHLLQSVFGGKSCNRFVCQGGCNVTNERFEDFYNLSLDVKHSKTIYESLNRYVNGELISDFYCESCDKKVDMTKKTCLSDLPNVLIIHLQRIIYNFDTYANEKINSRLEFPHVLNLEPYTRDSVLKQQAGESAVPQASPEFEYELVGVVMHRGVAEGGHYTSLIRHRNPEGVADPKRWYEFNDSLIRFYDPIQLEADCFGGVSDLGDDIGYGKSYNYSKDMTCSAYMLVYERKVRTPIKLLPFLEGDSTTSPRTFDEHPYDQLTKTVPAAIIQSVLRDNEKITFERHLYSAEFFKFFAEILQASVSIPEVNLTKLATHFALEVMAHAFDNRLLSDVIQTLKKLYSKYEFECVDLLESILADNMRGVLELLLICTEKTTRSCIADLLAHVLNILAKADTSDQSLAKRFMSALLDLIPKEAHKHWVRFQQFWELFRDFSAGGQDQAHFLIEKGAIGTLIDFYLGGKSPLLKPGEKRETLGNKMWGPTYDGLVQTVAILAAYCSPDPDSLTGPGLWLDEDSQKCIMDKEFIDKTLRGGFDGKALGAIIARWGKGNFDYSLKVAQILLKVLNDIEYDEVKGLYDVLDAYITIQDSYQRFRIEWLMGFPVPFKTAREELRLPCYGSTTISAIDDEVWTYLTPLCFGHNSYDNPESILALIWRHRRRYDQYCVGCIKNLFNICLKSKELSAYMERLPAPTYQYARYIDWIEEYLLTFKESQANYSSNYVSQKEDTLPEASNVYQLFKSASLQLHPFPYVLGKTVDCRLYDSLDVGDIQMLIYEYTTEYIDSKPNGKMNDALPMMKTRAEMPVKSFTSYRPSQLSLDTPNKSFSNYPKQNMGDEVLDEELDKKSIPMKTFATSEDTPEVAGSELTDEPQMDQRAALILRFVAKNHGLDGHRVVLALKGEEAKNYLCPESDITIEVTGKSEKDLVTLVKLDASRDWGEVCPVLRLESALSIPSQIEDFKETVVPYINVEEMNIHISDAGSADEDGKAPFGMVSCPQCTLYNPANAVKCDACDNPLKSIS